MIGRHISPILIEVENVLWFHEANIGEQPMYSDEGFRAACKIFMSAIMDKMYSLQLDERIPNKIKIDMALKCGEDIRKLIKVYTNVDPHEFYKTK